MARDDVVVIVSLDTEEDNWNRSRTDVSVKNINELPRQAHWFERLGVRPTYFTTYTVLNNPCAAAVMRDVGSCGAELAAHLHPWNTPPLRETFVPRNSMTKNLPADLQLEKVQTLTAAFVDAFGVRPQAFRAGRFGLGPDTVTALVACGYRIDSSISPFIDLASTDDGPSFVGAPIEPYWLAPGHDLTRPAPDGKILEIPLSYGFSRGPFSFWDPARRLLETPPLRWLGLPAIASKTGVVRRICLGPEFERVSDMLTLSARMLEHGVRHLHVSWHTPTLKPGLSPFSRTAADVERLYASIERYLEGLAGLTSFKFATVSEAAALLG